MCKGEADASPDPIRLPDRDPQRPKTTQTRPNESRRGERPPSRKVEERASSSHPDKRPASSSHRQRPSSSRNDPRPVTAGSSSRKTTSSHTSSSRPRTSAPREYTKHGKSRALEQLTIPEGGIVQYTEDKKLMNDVALLHGMIDHHTHNFYSREDFDDGDAEPELCDGALRRKLLRHYIGREILEKIVNAENPRSDETVEKLATKLAERFLPYAIQNRNSQRISHILDLYRLGVRIRGLIYNNPSVWTFDEWEEPQLQHGSIVVFPALLQDGEQVAPSEIVRV